MTSALFPVILTPILSLMWLFILEPLFPDAEKSKKKLPHFSKKKILPITLSLLLTKDIPSYKPSFAIVILFSVQNPVLKSGNATKMIGSTGFPIILLHFLFLMFLSFYGFPVVFFHRKGTVYTTIHAAAYQISVFHFVVFVQ